MFKKAKEISDDKVNIAVNTYEMVDKHIRKLDSDLAKFESEMKVNHFVHYIRQSPLPPGPQSSVFLASNNVKLVQGKIYHSYFGHCLVSMEGYLAPGETLGLLIKCFIYLTNLDA